MRVEQHNSTSSTKTLLFLQRLALIASLPIVFAVLYFFSAQFYTWDLRGTAPYSINTIGARDTLTYWTAFRAALAKENPYDQKVLRSVQFTGTDVLGPADFVAPPWTLMLLSPILVYDFPVCQWLWFSAALFSLFATPLFVRRWFTGSVQLSPYTCWLLNIWFIPVIDVLYFGQLSPFLGAIISSFVVCVLSKREIRAGMLLAILTVKPQLFILSFIAIGIYLVANKRFTILVSCCVTFALLLVITEVALPGAMLTWSTQLSATAELSFLKRTSNLPSVIRGVIFDVHGTMVQWPILLFPIAAAIAVTAYVVANSHQLDLRVLVAWTIPLNLLTTPYSWGHDFSLLIITHAWMLLYCEAHAIKEKQRLLANLIFLDLCLLLIGFLGISPLYRMWWIPLIDFVIAWRAFGFPIFLPSRTGASSQTP